MPPTCMHSACVIFINVRAFHRPLSFYSPQDNIRIYVKNARKGKVNQIMNTVLYGDGWIPIYDEYIMFGDCLYYIFRLGNP